MNSIFPANYYSKANGNSAFSSDRKNSNFAISYFAESFGYKPSDPVNNDDAILHCSEIDNAIDVIKEFPVRFERLFVLLDTTPELDTLAQLVPYADKLLVTLKPCSNFKLRALSKFISENPSRSPYLYFQVASSTSTSDVLSSSELFGPPSKKTPGNHIDFQLRGTKLNATQWLDFLLGFHASNLKILVSKILEEASDQTIETLENAALRYKIISTTEPRRDLEGFSQRKAIARAAENKGLQALARTILNTATPNHKQQPSYDLKTAEYISALHRLRDFSTADAFYQHFSGHCLKSAQFRIRWSNTKHCLHDNETARNLLEDDISENGPTPNNQLWLAFQERVSGNQKTAIDLLAEAIDQLPQSAPERAFLYFETALSLADLGLNQKAITALENSLSTPNKNPTWRSMVYFELSLLNYIEGHKDRARSVAISSSESIPFPANPCHYLTSNTSEMKVKNALTVAKSWPIPQYPYHKWAYLFAGREILLHQQKTETSIQEYGRYIGESNSPLPSLSEDDMLKCLNLGRTLTHRETSFIKLLKNSNTDF